MDKSTIRMNDKFAFVILHYMALDATIECVESIIESCDGNDFYEIVIVDNGSLNSTGAILEEKYSGYKNVHCILVNENLGFARGNNAGYQFAKEKLKCNYICMLNNDTILLQKSFISKCHEIYEQCSYAVIGPMIIRKDGTVQPLIKTMRSKKFYILYRYFLMIELLISRLGIDTVKITETILKFLHRNKKDKTREEVLECYNSQKNIRLHGCCWIFTPKFVEKFQGINNRTFLYREEELLFIMLKKNGLESFYTPELTIHHMEDVATDMILNTSKKKREFIYRNEIASLKIVIDELSK